MLARTPTMFAITKSIQSSKNPDDLKLDSNDIQFGDSLYTSDDVDVYLGEWNKQQVAIKEFKQDDNSQTDYKCEKAIMTKIALLPESSPHIIECHGYIEDEIKTALVFEYMNCDLYDYIHNRINIDYMKLNDISLQIAYGLKFLHKNNFIHCDIKLENIMFKSNQVKIIDFNLSLTTDNNQLDYIVGTEGYYAPELLLTLVEYKQTFTYTSKVDMYAYYIVLHVLYTGHFPYEAENFSVEDILNILNIMEEQPKSTCVFPKGIPGLLTATSMFSPNLRCSAETAVEELEKIIETHKKYA